MADDTARTGTEAGLQRPFDEVLGLGGYSVKLRREPISDDVLATCLRAAGSGMANPQRCELIVLRDPDRLHQMARIYRQGWGVYRRLVEFRGGRTDAHQWEADHFEDVPAVVVGCARGIRPLFPAVGSARYYAAVLPPMQNLLLAGRALGLAASFTTLPVWSGWQARRTLDLPFTVTPVAVAVLGWPAEPLKPASRRPLASFSALDHHGEPFPEPPAGD